MKKILKYFIYLILLLVIIGLLINLYMILITNNRIKKIAIKTYNELKARGVKIPNLSTELVQGMSIKAYNGGRMAEVER